MAMKYRDYQLMSKDKKNKLLPELRFQEFDEPWSFKHGDTLFDQISNKDHHSDLPILAITQEYGAIPRDKIDYNVVVTDKSVESYKVVEVGDFIISLRSFQGGIEYSSYKGICSPAYIILRKKVNLENSFFKYYFKTNVFINNLNKNIEGIRDGKMVSYKQFSELLLPMPSKQEQKKIADCLSSLDDLISLETQRLDVLKAYIKGLMQNFFPQEGEALPKFRFPEFRNNGKWEENILNNYLELLTDFEANGSFADVKKNVTVYDERNYAWYVRATDLENNNDVDSIKYVDNQGYKFLRKTSLFGGELLVSKRGEIGKVFLFEAKENLPATLAPNLYLLKMNSSANPKYFYYYFNSIVGNYALRRLNASSTIGALYKDDVKNIRLYAPLLPEQQKIADCLSSIDNMISAQSKKIDMLKLHKKGLMQQLFPSTNDLPS